MNNEIAKVMKESMMQNIKGLILVLWSTIVDLRIKISEITLIQRSDVK